MSLKCKRVGVILFVHCISSVSLFGRFQEETAQVRLIFTEVLIPCDITHIVLVGQAYYSLTYLLITRYDAVPQIQMLPFAGHQTFQEPPRHFSIWQGCSMHPQIQRISFRGKLAFSLPVWWNVIKIKHSTECSLITRLIIDGLPVLYDLIGSCMREMFYMGLNFWNIYPDNPGTKSLEVGKVPLQNVK